MQIGLLRTAHPLYGGSQYESMMMNALAREHNTTVFEAMPWIPYGYRPQSFLRAAVVERRAKVGVWIRNEVALTSMTTRGHSKQVALIHHLDESIGPIGIWNRALHRRLVNNIRRCDRVVVVSKYWQRRLSELGVKVSALIYNAFEVTRFAVLDEDVRNFKATHGLIGKPVIYIGNCQKRKGAQVVWRALRDKGYHLVTSGLSDIDIPIQQFLLPYEQYILLLAASDAAIAMSDFEEGWSRTSHEALLCKTPVVGSGAGGMGELLNEAGQLVCRDFAELPDMVRYAVTNRGELGRRGHAFASLFTAEHFGREWLRVIADI